MSESAIRMAEERMAELEATLNQVAAAMIGEVAPPVGFELDRLKLVKNAELLRGLVMHQRSEAAKLQAEIARLRALIQVARDAEPCAEVFPRMGCTCGIERHLADAIDGGL